MAPLRKLASLSAGDVLLLLRAQLALVVAQVVVWTRPRGQLVGASSATGVDEAPAERLTTPDERAARRLSLAVRRAGAYGVFRPLCLVRAVALQRMLERRGISGTSVRVGVRVTGGRFAAHAWVQRGDLVLGDDEENVNGYAPLSDVRVGRTG